MAAAKRFDPYAFLKSLALPPATAATDATKVKDVAVVAGVAATLEFELIPDEERSAIIEADSGAPREWAEGYARLLTLPPLVNVPPGRWKIFVDDCGRFLDRWAGTADALGWTASELFGVGCRNPVGAVHLAGLLWLLRGADLIALTETVATIRLPSGAVQTYIRMDVGPDRRPAWQIFDIASKRGAA